ncbi:MAG: hypothetical protein ACREON_14990 [Gemmatimonadaceae bacterium]
MRFVRWRYALGDLMFTVRSRIVVAIVVSTAGPALAQTGRNPGTARPPDVLPSTWARVPRQVERDPFATTTLGIEVSAFTALASRWSLPSSNGEFERLETPGLGQQDLYLGALHFFGHADFFVSFPLWSRSRSVYDNRSLSLDYSVAAGVKLYPVALRPGTLRPYLSSALTTRALEVTDGGSVDANVGRLSQVVVPVGAGVTWRSSRAFLVDAQVQYVPGSATVSSGIAPRRLEEPAEPHASERLDLSGVRFVASVRWSRHLAATSMPGYREAKARALQRRIDDGSISAVNIALGPSTRLFNNNSPYFRDRRPYLRDQYDAGLFPHASVGYYQFTTDAEIRLAYRRVTGEARAFGARLETQQSGLFLEAMKFFDIDLYGFVPFVGAGVGYGRLHATDHSPGGSVTSRESVWMLSIPFGWDIRPNPASSWLLRTNLRWLPRARAVFPGSGVRLDMGGLEFDFIQLVLFPERLFRR